MTKATKPTEHANGQDVQTNDCSHKIQPLDTWASTNVLTSVSSPVAKRQISPNLEI
ncbi:hypothetical protein WAI453_005339 [Rhynchosporium graminicola]